MFILNIILFKTIWLLTVYTVANQLYFVGPIAVILNLCIHLIFSKNKLINIKLYALTSLVGFFVDTLLIQGQVISFSDASFISPLYMICLWLNFSTLFEYGLSWSLKKPIIAITLLAFSAPFSYFSAFKLNAIGLQQPLYFSLVCIGVLWAFSTGLLLYKYKDWMKNE